jgi:PIN domain nuclease of toxin-antitoxin system
LNLLLDSNVLLWWLADSPRLSGDARKMIMSSPIVYVSAATTWEIEIKRAIGKLKAPENLEEVLSANHFVHLPITVAHSVAAAKLPRHHGDPFDRMLIAQAVLESLTLLTGDRRMKDYGARIQVVEAL